MDDDERDAGNHGDRQQRADCDDPRPLPLSSRGVRDGEMRGLLARIIGWGQYLGDPLVRLGDRIRLTAWHDTRRFLVARLRVIGLTIAASATDWRHSLVLVVLVPVPSHSALLFPLVNWRYGTSGRK